MRKIGGQEGARSLGILSVMLRGCAFLYMLWNNNGLTQPNLCFPRQHSSHLVESNSHHHTGFMAVAMSLETLPQWHVTNDVGISYQMFFTNSARPRTNPLMLIYSCTHILICFSEWMRSGWEIASIPIIAMENKGLVILHFCTFPLKSQMHYLLTIWPWTSYLSSLHLRCLVCKIRIISVHLIQLPRDKNH